MSRAERVAARTLRPPRLAAFVLAVVAWLPATFLVWYLAAPLLLWPAVLLVEGVARLALHGLVQGVQHAASTLVFATTLRGGTAAGNGMISVEVNLLLYAFGMPLLAALVLAVRDRRWKRQLLLGWLVLLPVVAFGALADFLKNVAITAGPAVASQAGFSAAGREAIAYAFQLGSLILPAVAPAVAWVLMHRAFLERLRERRAQDG
jgi:hypothetical protein